MKHTNRDRYYTITEAAKELGITRAAVHRAIKQQRLKATWGPISPPPEAWGISAKDLNEYRVSLVHQWVGKKTD
jgi:hypothetical protein